METGSKFLTSVAPASRWKAEVCELHSRLGLCGEEKSVLLKDIQRRYLSHPVCTWSINDLLTYILSYINI